MFLDMLQFMTIKRFSFLIVNKTLINRDSRKHSVPITKSNDIPRYMVVVTDK